MTASTPLCAAIVLVLLAAAGCGGQQLASASPDPTLAPCVPDGAAVNMPTRVVEVLPLPVGTRVTRAQLVGAGPLVIAGYIPGDAAEVSDFFTRELVRSGFTLSAGQASGGRSGSALEGHGLVGRWEVSRLADCEGSVAFTVSVSER